VTHAVKCLVCNTILRSVKPHDFQKCKCPNETFVDSGVGYYRAGGIDPTQIEVIKEENSVKADE